MDKDILHHRVVCVNSQFLEKVVMYYVVYQQSYTYLKSMQIFAKKIKNLQNLNFRKLDQGTSIYTKYQIGSKGIARIFSH